MQACTFGVTGNDQRWCFKQCKVKKRTLEYLQTTEVYSLKIRISQVWQIPFFNLSPSLFAKPGSGLHSLVPSNYAALAQKVAFYSNV